MKSLLKAAYLLLFVLMFVSTTCLAQSISSFKQKNKWGFKKGESIIIEPQYDTTFGFDQTNSVALVGNINPAKKSINPLTKEIKVEYQYFYIKSDNQKIHIKRSENDSVFEVSLTKQSPAGYLTANRAFIANVSGKKYLMHKNGYNVSQMGYDQISFTKFLNCYKVETKDVKSGHTHIGILGEQGKYIIQQVYSGINLNTVDSLFICCTSGVKYNGSDDVYNYIGNKVHSSARHIQYCGKNFAVYRLFESENSYVVFDIHTNKERELKAEWVYYLNNDKLVLLDGDWYFYDMKTDKRFPIDKKIIKYYHLNGYN